MKNTYFKLSEFDSPDLKGSGALMDETFIDMLIEARAKANIPFKINSGYRTKEYNKSLLKRGYKASKNSSHLKGCAADIHCVDSTSRFIIYNSLIDAGFTRIGVAKNFIHVDCDVDKPINKFWTY